MAKEGKRRYFLDIPLNTLLPMVTVNLVMMMRTYLCSSKVLAFIKLIKSINEKDELLKIQEDLPIRENKKKL
jgi:hypothetical protein